jgi:hypothetical protein
MKKLIVLLVLAVSVMASSQFSSGYRAGFKEGACYGCYGCLAPLPDIGEDDWQGGYNRGFIDGLKENRCR